MRVWEEREREGKEREWKQCGMYHSRRRGELNCRGNGCRREDRHLQRRRGKQGEKKAVIEEGNIERGVISFFLCTFSNANVWSSLTIYLLTVSLLGRVQVSLHSLDSLPASIDFPRDHVCVSRGSTKNSGESTQDATKGREKERFSQCGHTGRGRAEHPHPHTRTLCKSYAHLNSPAHIPSDGDICEALCLWFNFFFSPSSFEYTHSLMSETLDYGLLSWIHKGHT